MCIFKLFYCRICCIRKSLFFHRNREYLYFPGVFIRPESFQQLFRFPIISAVGQHFLLGNMSSAAESGNSQEITNSDSICRKTQHTVTFPKYTSFFRNTKCCVGLSCISLNYIGFLFFKYLRSYYVRQVKKYL